jgi:sulfite exporter TauE/SafE
VNLAAVFVTGLLAGGVSCAAVQGGLLAGLMTRQRRGHAPQAAASAATNTQVGTQTLERRSPFSHLGEDLVPVGGFLVGKLVSHTLLGALLGAMGSAVQLSVGARTTLQLVAGVVVVVFGLAQLGVPGFRNIVIEPPLSWMKIVRNQARSQAALAPGLLGLVTILIPCGVTISVEALALTTGSAWTGAATMAVFVLGTSPLFAVLGYLARKAATAWRGRLAIITGIAVVAMGLYTFNGGLELAGSPWAASRLTHTAASAGSPSSDPAVSTEDGKQTVTITASTGYNPNRVQIRAGVPTTLVVHSENAEGCLRELTIPSRDVDKILPAQGDTRIDLGAVAPGQLAYSCGMGMYTGTITAS